VVKTCNLEKQKPRMAGLMIPSWEGQGWVNHGRERVSLQLMGFLIVTALTHPALRAPLRGGDRPKTTAIKSENLPYPQPMVTLASPTISQPLGEKRVAFHPLNWQAYQQILQALGESRFPERAPVRPGGRSRYHPHRYRQTQSLRDSGRSRTLALQWQRMANLPAPGEHLPGTRGQPDVSFRA